MEITVKLESLQIFVNIEKDNSFAVMITNLGQTYKLTIPELIEALQIASEVMSRKMMNRSQEDK